MNLTQEEKQLLLSLIHREQKELKYEMELWDQHRASARGQGVCPNMFRDPHNPPKPETFETLDRLESLVSSADDSEGSNLKEENQMLKQTLKDLRDRIHKASAALGEAVCLEGHRTDGSAIEYADGGKE